MNRSPRRLIRSSHWLRYRTAMAPDRPILVFGPAYLDIIVEVDGPLVPGDPALFLDQSLPAVRFTPADDGVLRLIGPHGDRMTFPLPQEGRDAGGTCEVQEPVLARLLGPATPRRVVAEYSVIRFATQLGGMGAGYAKALNGTLRMPLGEDAVGHRVLAELAQYAISAAPRYLPTCPSDTSLVILATRGEKLAVGVREAMVRWLVAEEDRALVAKASALVFCGAPNALMAEVLSWQPDVPVMCAPALRNVCDQTVPFADLAGGIHYLTMNALEWENLAGREQIRAQVPVITVTDGPMGSRVLLGGEEITIPAIPYQGTADTNRAGETYGATFFSALLNDHPDFLRQGISRKTAEQIGMKAACRATKQLAIKGFAFPPAE
ncbi:MAG: carbohydrate kinase family protein [Armatimonadota bacterium]